MASVKNLLTDSLEDLTTHNLKVFQRLLQNHGRIPASEMENADALDTVDMMVAYFGPEEAVKITVDILRKMNQYLLAEELVNKHKEAQTEGSMKASSTFGADSKQPIQNKTASFHHSNNEVISDQRWMRMASVRELLENSLEDLTTADLRVFQWHLKNHGHIPASEMENADILHTVNMMVACLGPEEAVKITVDILSKMNQYLLAEEIENNHKQAQTEGSMKASSKFGAISKPIWGLTLMDSKADLLDYTAEGGASHTCSSHKFSEPKPSGLNIQPLLNCQSCVHITDSDQWVQIEPSASTDEGGSKFRVSTDPGRYECVRTRMRWVCDCNVTLQYRTVDGHFLNTELRRLQCHRIAPVMDVTVISGKLEEVHLPHYACLGESDPSLKDAVKLLTIHDEGITTEPVQLTRFHAKIVQPSFSLITLIMSWIMRWDEYCDLLLKFLSFYMSTFFI